MELLVAILLMQVHAVRQHLLNVSNLDRHVDGEVRAVHINAPRVNIVEAPDPQMLHKEVKAATCDEMQRLFLLDGDEGDPKQVWSSHYVSLEVNVVRLLALN